jgi:hypothetical protein
LQKHGDSLMTCACAVAFAVACSAALFLPEFA